MVLSSNDSVKCLGTIYTIHTNINEECQKDITVVIGLYHKKWRNGSLLDVAGIIALISDIFQLVSEFKIMLML